MPSPLEPPYITADHFAAFGRVLHAFSVAEDMFGYTLMRAVELRPWQAALMLSQYGFDQKRRLLENFITESDEPDGSKKEILAAISAIHADSSLRNNVAHCVWRTGARPGTIKPFFLSTKGKLKILGISQNEKEWSAPDLHASADAILGKIDKLKSLLVKHGLIPE